MYTDKNLIIIGAGNGYSFSLARIFGQRGYNVGLISRSAEKLMDLCDILHKENIHAFWAVADAGDLNKLELAITELKTTMGGVSVMIYNAARMKMVDIMREKVPDISADLNTNFLHALSAIQLIEEDLKTSKGAVIFTGSNLALKPVPLFGSLSIGKAALRSLALMLNIRLAPYQIFVGLVTINGFIDEDDPIYSPNNMAKKTWEFTLARNSAELII